MTAIAWKHCFGLVLTVSRSSPTHASPGPANLVLDHFGLGWLIGVNLSTNPSPELVGHNMDVLNLFPTPSSAVASTATTPSPPPPPPLATPSPPSSPSNAEDPSAKDDDQKWVDEHPQ
ncbi:hypothetical protein NL676_008112 [Syzygium grande]|nr:hypothetical protein NL676_008112 [Syzygium grande]